MRFYSQKLMMALVVIGFGFTGCIKTSPQSSKAYQQRSHLSEAQKKEAYLNAREIVGNSIQNDKYYSRLALDTPELKNWFSETTYKLWDHQITKAQFMTYGLKKFPNHKYELNKIADGLLNN